MARVSPDVDDTLKFSLKIDWDAKKAIKAIKDVARSNPAAFKSAPTVLYSSLNGNMVELEISCKVDPTKKAEAKNILIETAYSSSAETPRGRAKASSEQE